MELADQAYVANRKGDAVLSLKLTREALEIESKAADLLRDRLDVEPTRSVLYRSAASLALDCGRNRVAADLVKRALNGQPPREIEEELKDILVDAKRNLKLKSDRKFWGPRWGLIRDSGRKMAEASVARGSISATRKRFGSHEPEVSSAGVRLELLLRRLKTFSRRRAKRWAVGVGNGEIELIRLLQTQGFIEKVSIVRERESLVADIFFSGRVIPETIGVRRAFDAETGAARLELFEKQQEKVRSRPSIRGFGRVGSSRRRRKSGSAEKRIDDTK